MLGTLKTLKTLDKVVSHSRIPSTQSVSTIMTYIFLSFFTTLRGGGSEVPATVILLVLNHIAFPYLIHIRSFLF